jgi:hypothetical protein
LGLIAVLAMFTLAASATQAQQTFPVSGWAAFTTYPNEYTIASEPLHRTRGLGAMGVAIESRSAYPLGTALLAQSIRADEFRGRRVRVAGWLRSEDVDGHTGLFARVDGAAIVQTSDFMLERPVVGTTAWRRYEIVLDVPSDAIGITFGLHLTGTGQVYADDFALDTVDNFARVTGGRGNVAVVTSKKPAFGNGDGGVSLAGEPRGGLSKALGDGRLAYARAPLRPVNLDFERLLSR